MMFIFGSSDNKKTETGSPSREIETIIGRGTSINGNVAANGNIRFDGTLEGNIDTTGHVVVGQNGNVIGNISASSLDVAGTITGNVTLVGNLTIHPTGQLIGDVRVKSLNIAEGGVFKGRSEMDVRAPEAAYTTAVGAENLGM